MAKKNSSNISETEIDSKVQDIISENLLNAQDIITDKVQVRESRVDPITKREGIYNDLIDAYKKHYETKSKHNRRLKIAFFCIIMSLIALLVIGLVVLCICIVFKWENSSESIAVIITSVGTILSTIIALPTIICNYLFHKKEDKYLLDFIVELNKKNDN
jgi:ABC-type proline/glycine betaine transport system permease subunit